VLLGKGFIEWKKLKRKEKENKMKKGKKKN